jgi:hypothetical protein
MPTKLTCPHCAKTLAFRGPSPEGKAFKCPGCATVFRVPVAPVAAVTAQATKARAKPLPSDEEDEAPRRRQRPAHVSIPPEEEEERERPRKRKRKKSNVLLIVGLAGGGVFFLLCTGVLGLIVWAVASSAPSWKEFKSPEGRFTATFPGAPKQQTQNVAGQPMKVFIVELGGGDFAYSVLYNDIGANVEALGAKALLSSVANGMGGNVKSKKEIQLKGHPGMEVTMEMRERGVLLELTDRIYLVKGRLYQVMVAGVKGKTPPASFTQFLDSFQIQE